MKETKLTVLERIVEYQTRNHQVGHTKTMIAGLQNNKNALVVVGGPTHAHWMRAKLISEYAWTQDEANNSIITVGQIRRGYLNAVKDRPLVIDNVGLFSLALEISDDRKEFLKAIREAEVGGHDKK